MTYRVYFKHQDETRDYIDIEGEDIEIIRERAYSELKKRNAQGLWSERLKDD